MVFDGPSPVPSDIGAVAHGSPLLRNLVLPIPDRLNIVLSLQRQQSRTESDGHWQAAQKL